ncbi:hypothetical protein B0H15DRAFT_799894 [Mycena belliarum]|uniref:Uncharacterized protein n=1 Tax=Mycena belliarum TaxID=1033014 RepID=A0AAD6U8K9_9AGAR|nr:hypothetical protein B0H15DRAFT_799894 [Mycena belliae]
MPGPREHSLKIAASGTLSELRGSGRSLPALLRVAEPLREGGDVWGHTQFGVDGEHRRGRARFWNCAGSGAAGHDVGGRGGEGPAGEDSGAGARGCKHAPPLPGGAVDFVRQAKRAIRPRAPEST